MAFHSARCPSCKKEIQVPDDVDTSICMYCGQSIVINDAISINAGPSIANLLGMARTAYAGGNHAEAEAYFNRVLELDPTISEAWLGKGKAAGWQSSLVNMRFGEVIAAFSHAIATVQESEKDITVQSCVTEANVIVVALYGIARKHMLEYVSLPNIWADYLGQVNQMLSTLETVSTWLPDRTTFENIVHLCKDNIEGVTYRDQFDNNMSKGWHLSPDYEAITRKRLDYAANKLREIDPSYTAPDAEAKKPDSCFVITATMGDPHHPTVNLMRKFRDQWILKRRGGSQFVSWYYKHGPAIARLVGKKRIFQKISYVLIVAPAASLARRLLESGKQ